ncbi:hypothetical protein [Nocardia altamirensis]|nr:hypothetical protein [Nocardia altamirensis]
MESSVLVIDASDRQADGLIEVVAVAPTPVDAADRLAARRFPSRAWQG